jgi:hypothetical protein
MPRMDRADMIDAWDLAQHRDHSAVRRLAKWLEVPLYSDDAASITKREAEQVVRVIRRLRDGDRSTKMGE